MTGCLARKPGNGVFPETPGSPGRSAETVNCADVPLLASAPSFGSLKLKAMEILRLGPGASRPRSNPDIHEIVIGKQFAYRKFSPDFALRICETLRPPHRH